MLRQSDSVRVARLTSLLAVFMFSSFGFMYLLQGSILLAVAVLLLAFFWGVNLWLCLKGDYNKFLNYVFIPTVSTLVTALVIAIDGVVGTYWILIRIVAGFYFLPRSIAWKVLLFYLPAPLVSSWLYLDSEVFYFLLVTIVIITLFVYFYNVESARKAETARNQARTDPLTGLLNRFLLNDFLEHAVNIHNRSGIPAVMIMFDIDHFKSINDRFGHPKGDEVLVSFADMLKNRFRATDQVFRIGGEEFLVLLYELSEEDGVRLAEQFLEEVSSSSLLDEDKVTVSAGVAALQAAMSWQGWMNICDKRLYKAKKAGRNRVVCR